MYRRQLVAGLAAAMPFIAGCTTFINGDSDDDTQPTSDSSTTTHASDPVSPTTAGTTMDKTTQTALSTSTATPTSTVTSTLTSPSALSQTSGSTSGTETVLIDPSTFVTYTSETHPYTLQYPASWRVDQTPENPANAVTFLEPSNDVYMQVQVHQTKKSKSLTQNVKKFLRGYKQSASQDGATVESIKRWDVTLQNGHHAMMIDIQTAVSSGEIRTRIVITQVNGTVYVVGLVLAERMLSPSVVKGMKTILTSLTVSPATQ